MEASLDPALGLELIIGGRPVLDADQRVAGRSAFCGTGEFPLALCDV